MKELNVIGTMQLLAACQKAPGLRNLVVKSTTTVYGASSRDPAMFTEDMEPRRLPRVGLRQGRRRGRGLRARVRPAPSRRPGHHAPGRQRDRPPRGEPDHLVLPAAGHPDRARLRPAAAVPPRAGPDRRAAARRRHRRARHLQRRRRRRPDASARRSAGCSDRPSRCPASPSAAWDRRCARPGWPTSRPSSSASSPTAAASTPPGCARCSASSRRTRPPRRSPTSAAPSTRPAASRSGRSTAWPTPRCRPSARQLTGAGHG